MTEQKEAAGEKPAAKIVSPKARTKKVPLDWPIEFEGKVYDEIELQRVTGRQIEAFVKALQDSEVPPQIPIINCPQEVYDALDDDDRLRLEDELRPFLPRRLAQAAELTQPTTGVSSEK